ncbi:MAG: serine/threonine-protein kinase, partial [Planctomycetota bacterium]
MFIEHPLPDEICAHCGNEVPAETEHCSSCLLMLACETTSQADDDLFAVEEGALADRRFGDYELVEEIARGGMGIVYRAKQIGLGREVALKTISAGPLASRDALRRFEIESEAAARLDHPAIVPVYQVGEQDGHCYYAMKLVEGGSLSDRVTEVAVASAESVGEARTRAQSAARYTLAVAQAIAYAHERGVLHRDIKPSNVLIDAEDQVLLADFGLAKLTEGDSSFQTLSSAAMGSPSYMSPEQASGQSASVTVSADVYGIGAVLSELLTGRPPFIAATPIATIRQVVERPPRSP